jgi:hypothetical protein
LSWVTRSDRLEVQVPLGVLEVLEAHLRGALQALDRGPALGFVGLQGIGDGALFAQRAGEHDGVLHGELRAGADREVRGVGGVSQQHNVAMVPAGVLDGAEAPPHRAVLLEGVSLELLGAQRLAEGDGVLLRGAVETGRAPRLLAGLDDEGGMPALVLIGVDAPEPVAVVLEIEREGRERTGGPEPDEPVRPPVDGRPEMVRIPVANGAVRPVGAEDEIRVEVRRGVGDFLAGFEADAELARAPGKNLEQRAPRKAGESVTGGAGQRAAIVDLDVVPAGRLSRHGVEGLRIRLLQVLLGRLGEHHAEAEGVARPVPLQHEHVVGRVGLLHQDREIQSGGSAPDGDDSHSRVAAALSSCPAMTRCWISVVPS